MAVERPRSGREWQGRSPPKLACAPQVCRRRGGVERVKGWRRRGRESKVSAVLYVLSVPTWPVDVGGRIYAFRRAYEPARAAIVPAHVTLVFGARAISQDELTAHVAEVARRTAPFRVSFSAAEIHEDSISGYKLFLLTDDGTHTLSTLHQALYVGGLRSELGTDNLLSPAHDHSDGR